jgi:hypothetical protein
MKRRKTFSIGWPAGYEPTTLERAKTAEELKASGGSQGGSALARAQLTPLMRAGGLEAIQRGRGTLGVLSPRSLADIAKNDKLRRGGI